MSAEVRQLIEFAVQDLVAEIVSHEGLAIEEAMDALYHSPFFKKLTDPATGLYRESGEYLYAAMRDVHELGTCGHISVKCVKREGCDSSRP